VTLRSGTADHPSGAQTLVVVMMMMKGVDVTMRTPHNTVVVDEIMTGHHEICLKCLNKE